MTGQSRDRTRRRIRPALWAGGALALGLAEAFAACGGTTGREDLPAVAAAAQNDATLGDAGADALPVDDASSNDDFEAGIQYASDARLAGFADATITPTPSDGGVAAAWPVCAPDMLVKPDGSTRLQEVPDDSGACSTYVWTPTYLDGGGGQARCGTSLCQTCDECIRRNECGGGITVAQGVLPPCSDMREAGTASQGPGAGMPLFDLCVALFDCVSQSGCTGVPSDPNANVSNCYCGTSVGAACEMAGAANGICKSAIEAAFQADPSVTAADILSNLTDITQSPAGSETMKLYECALTANCGLCFFSDGGVDGG